MSILCTFLCRLGGIARFLFHKLQCSDTRTTLSAFLNGAGATLIEASLTTVTLTPTSNPSSALKDKHSSAFIRAVIDGIICALVFVVLWIFWLKYMRARVKKRVYQTNSYSLPQIEWGS
ncbi:hypothetical protein BDZ45DRAFT_254224 [Acephala macrosclerotiorum]|nr:hypothetical protein BDZ45DRAFT_254224 [Acephala macrosclerotiorum]